MIVGAEEQTAKKRKGVRVLFQYKNIFYLSIYKCEKSWYNKYCNQVNNVDNIKRE